MMSYERAIRACLEQHLLTVAGLPDLKQFQNVEVDPIPGKPHLSASKRTTSSRPTSIGPNPIVEHLGLFLVDLSMPKKVGAGATEDLISAIRKAFKPGLSLRRDGVTVIVRWSEGTILPGGPGDQWFRASATIGWRSHEPT